jgi:hypothetical protein
MRAFPTILALVLAAAPVLAAPVALACGDDVTNTIAIDPIRPAGTGEADQLLSQASELDVSATSSETSATSFDKQADAFMTRVRSLRTLASQIADPGRSEMLVKAAGIEAQATSARSRATQLRRHAADLRNSARELRLIAQEMNEGTRGQPRVFAPANATTPAPGTGPTVTSAVVHVALR